MSSLPEAYHLLPEVQDALAGSQPVVALESTVITHGLPHPQNLELARDMEAEVRQQGATPATIAVLDGVIHIGLRPDQLERLAQAKDPVKISTRDFGVAIALRRSGGATVAGTLVAAHAAGIRVFATGGIGGVHREAPFDVSTDLVELGRTPVLVVCAGAKAILDLPATLERLETLATPLVGYQTDEFPAFYAAHSGLPLGTRVETPEQAAQIAQAHWALGLRSAVLVVQPPPPDVALPYDEVEGVIQQALREAQQQNLRGQGVTPFLLARVSELTQGSSLRANLALLRNNARLAAQIARSMAFQCM